MDTFKGSTTLSFEADGYKKNIALLKGDSLTAFYRHFQLLRLMAKVRVEPLVGMTTEVAGRYQGGPIGMLLIDADHSYESCKSDFLAWEQHLAPGAIVMFHDYEPPFPGVIKAVDELVETQPLEHQETVYTLKIYRFYPPQP